MDVTQGVQVDVEEIGKGPKAICVLCESGYHDHAWEISHVMQCGCPCHVKRSSATQAGS